MESSNEFFQISGVDFSGIESTFNSTFTKVDTEMDTLITKLNEVLNSYSELRDVLQKLFNTDLAKQLSDILGAK